MKPDQEERVEARRQKMLEETQILDSPPEQAFDDLVYLAASICDTPFSAISFIDEDRQWFKASFGFQLSELKRNLSFCTYTILSDEILQVSDTLQDSRFSSSPLVSDPLNIRFYAGAPLILSDGLRLGSICVLDRQPRHLSEEQKKSLQILARQVISQIELSRKYRQIQESEQRIKEQKNMLDAVADNLPGALYRCAFNDENHLEIKYLSKGAHRFFPAETQNALNKRILKAGLVHPIDRPEFEKALAKSLKDLSPFKWEGRLQDIEGVSKWTRVVSTPHRLNGNINWDGIILDIDYEKNLEQLVTKEKQISVEAMKAATFGKLANGLAHEINNPLAIIKGICFVVDKKSKQANPEPELLAKALDTINVNVDRITMIMASLQNLSVSAQKQAFETTTIDRVIDSARALVSDCIQQNSVRLHIVSPKDLYFRCRPASISRALANLLINSCEAIKDSKDPWIHILAEETQGIVKITVSNNGLRIKSEDIPFIMDPFFTTKDIGEGNGLGLAVSKAVFEDHGGQLTYEPNHKHTTFAATLPARIDMGLRDL